LGKAHNIFQNLPVKKPVPVEIWLVLWNCEKDENNVEFQLKIKKE